MRLQYRLCILQGLITVQFLLTAETTSDNELRRIIVYITRSENRFSSHKRQNITFFNSIKRLCQITYLFVDSVPLLCKVKNITIIVSMINKKVYTFLLKGFESSIIRVNSNLVNNYKRVRKIKNTELAKVKFITAFASEVSINTLIFRLKKLNFF